MKKVLLITLLLSFCLVIYSQEPNKSLAQELDDSNIELEHIKFMGVSLSGSFNEFKEKIVDKGFKFKMVNDNNLTVLSGKFAGHAANILLEPTRDKQIGSVQVLFADNGKYFTSWKKISSLYTELKKQLIAKYGAPTICNENFLGGQYLTDKAKMLAVVQDKCDYECIFEIIGKMSVKEFPALSHEISIGNVSLHISKDQTIRLSYTDLQQASKEYDDNFNDL